MYIVIAGGGKVAEFLAHTLLEEGHEIVVIEQQPDVANRLVEILRGRILVLQGDACDPEMLLDAGIKQADILVATTGKDDDNLVTCEISKVLFDVPRAIARINNPRNEAIFRKLGIEGIASTTIISRMIRDEAIFGDIRAVLSLQQGDLVLFEVVLPRISHPSDQRGVRVSDLTLPEGTLLVAVARGDRLETVSGETVLQVEDKVVVCVRSDQEDEVRRALLEL